MEPVIPPRKNRTAQSAYDKNPYKLRHLVENAFLHLKQWRAIATRYAENTASCLAAIHIRCMILSDPCSFGLKSCDYTVVPRQSSGMNRCILRCG